ncbi:hypothetical protein [Candidatus Finniella inopinata]|nr:hypothetical protein [Candidatus Finniella inopinata]
MYLLGFSDRAHDPVGIPFPSKIPTPHVYKDLAGRLDQPTPSF